MMRSEDKINEQFNDFLSQFLNASNVVSWRNNTKELYDAMAGSQWAQDDYDQRVTVFKKPVTTCNRMAPIIHGLSGYGVLNKTQIEIAPRKDFAQPQEEENADQMSDAVEYLQDESHFHFESSYITKDSMICGIGATVSYFDYDKTPYGEFKVDRIFPGFILWDFRASKRNFTDATECGYVEVVSRDWLDEEIKDIKGEQYVSGDIGTRTTNYVSRFLDFLNNVQTQYIDFVYHYEWFEREPMKMFRNPLLEQGIEEMPVLMELLADYEESSGIDLSEPFLYMDRKQYRQFRNVLGAYAEQGGVDIREFIEPKNTWQRKYYKARIARGVVLEASESWANDFTIQFKTGYYDETARYFYGLGRAMLPMQRLLNESMSDYQSYLQSIPKGGVYVRPEAVENMADFLKQRMNEQNVTPISDLDGIRDKPIPPVPGGLTDFIGLTSQMLTSVIGIPQDFFGQVESGNMTHSLMSKIVKQSYMVLADYFESGRMYIKAMGQIMVDGVFVLTDNYDGIPIRKITDNGTEELNLYKDSLSRKYEITVQERPLSDDEKIDQFAKLMEMAGVLMNKPNPVDITPLAVAAYPYEFEMKQQVLEMMQPPPPPQPDPQMQALLEAETQEKVSVAGKNAADAELKQAQTLEKLQAIREGRTETPVSVDDLIKLEKHRQEMELAERKMKNEEAQTMLKAKQVDIETAKVMAAADKQDKEEAREAVQIVQNFDEPMTRMAESLNEALRNQSEGLGEQITATMAQLSGQSTDGIRNALESSSAMQRDLATGIEQAMSGIELPDNSAALEAVADSLSRIEQGQKLIAGQDLNLQELLVELLEKMGEKPKSEDTKPKKIEFEYDKDGEIIGAVEVDGD